VPVFLDCGPLTSSLIDDISLLPSGGRSDRGTCECCEAHRLPAGSPRNLTLPPASAGPVVCR
jgi:hypothetical protein